MKSNLVLSREQFSMNCIFPGITFKRSEDNENPHAAYRDFFDS
jgi:hypothetical protein